MLLAGDYIRLALAIAVVVLDICLIIGCVEDWSKTSFQKKMLARVIELTGSEGIIEEPDWDSATMRWNVACNQEEYVYIQFSDSDERKTRLIYICEDMEHYTIGDWAE